MWAGLPIIFALCGNAIAVYLSILAGRAVGALIKIKSPERHGLFGRILILIVVLIALALFMLVPELIGTIHSSPLALPIYIIIYLCALNVWAFAHGIRGSIEEIASRSVVFTTLLYVVALSASIVLTSLFVKDIYPRIPQALGGAKPQCGQLDLRRADFSQETLMTLGASPGQEVARTEELEIFFQSSSTVIVGLATQDDEQGERFEIDRQGVAAIKVC